MSLYYTMKQMLPVAEGVGNIKEVGMTENWIGLKVRKIYELRIKGIGNHPPDSSLRRRMHRNGTHHGEYV